MPYGKVGPWNNGLAPALSAANLDTIETQYEEAMADVLTVAETEVYNAAAPVGWTDLDLSATVGALSCLVLLKVTETSNTAATQIAVRKNGDTDEFLGAAYNVSMSLAGQNSGYHVVLACFTDTAGQIEIRANAANTLTIDVMGYVKRE